MFDFSQTSDGSVIVSTSESGGMDRDLVFASGAMNGDPLLETQKELAKFIVFACNNYIANNQPPNKTWSRLFEGWGGFPAVANQSKSDSPE